MNEIFLYRWILGIWGKNAQTSCIFCNLSNFGTAQELTKNTSAYSILAPEPISKYHTIVLPKRHVTSYFDLTTTELTNINKLVFASQKKTKTRDPSVVGFNIFVNVGEAAGQTIPHCQIHLVPVRLSTSSPSPS